MHQWSHKVIVGERNQKLRCFNEHENVLQSQCELKSDHEVFRDSYSETIMNKKNISKISYYLIFINQVEDYSSGFRYFYVFQALKFHSRENFYFEKYPTIQKAI